MTQTISVKAEALSKEQLLMVLDIAAKQVSTLREENERLKEIVSHTKESLQKHQELLERLKRDKSV